MKKLFLLLVAVLSIGLCASAQMRTVSGTVIDATNDEPLVGVSVAAPGSNQGVVTDIDGDFSIVLPATTTKLSFSYVGFETQVLVIPATGKMTVKLRPGENILDEVIAVAYGTAKKSEYTGSASVVKADQLEDALVTTVTNALTGRVAGVQTLSSNGQPGEQPSVLIRGVGSINASTRPLYVVDGVPYSGDISSIPATDIEAMTVLKDAASAALYGARGANGVILLTTKKGREGTARVSFDARWGANHRALPNYDVITDPRQYIEQVYKAHYMTAKVTPTLGDPRTYALKQLWPSIGYQTWTAPAGQYIIGADGRFNPNATPGYLYPDGYLAMGDDWTQQLCNGLRQEYNVSVSGGNDKFSFYLGASYLGDDGIIENSGFNRFSTRAAVDYQAKPWLKLGSNIMYTYTDMKAPGNQVDAGHSGNAFQVANGMAPVYPMYVRDVNGQIQWNDRYNLPIFDYGDGTYGGKRNYMSMSNPLCDLYYNIDAALMDVLDAKWYALVTPVEGLTINGNVGYFVDNTRSHNLPTGLYGQGVVNGGQASQGQSRIRTINVQGLAEYQRTFAEHHNASIMIGYESFSRWDESVSAIGSNLYNPGSWAVSNTIDQKSGSGAGGGYATRGFFGRLKYNYADRYFFMGSFRRDGSSRFHPDHRWGNFWSASAAWEIAKEKFMEEFTNVDMLKFKFSFGQNGNDNIGNYYAYLDQYTMTGADGVFSDSQLVYKGNPEITWETSNNLNVGFDFSFFKGMLSGTAEYYQRQVTDMLFNVPTDPSLGYTSQPKNVGSMRNNGFELELNYRPVNTRDITWDIYANITIPQNKVLKLAPELLDGNGDWISGSRILREGESMYNMYLVKSAGVDSKTGEALYWYREKLLDADGNVVVKNGMTQYADEEKTTADWSLARESNRVSTGNIMPKGYGGFGTSLQAYGFDLAVNFSYQFGGRQYDNSYVDYMSSMNSKNIGQNLHKDALNAWTQEGDITDVPRLNTEDQYINALSDRFVISSNYIALNNLTVGYTLPEKFTSKFYLHNVRVYFSGENIALWSKRKGFDPRQSFLASSNDTYSPIRCLSGGIRLNF